MRSRLGSKEKAASGRWRVRVSVGYGADGVQRTISRTVDTEEEADRAIAEIAADMGRRPEMGAGVTLSKVWELYQRDKAPRLAVKSQKNYDWCMRRYWLPRLGSRDVTSLCHADVQSVLTPLTRQNAIHARVALSSVLTYAVGEGLLSRNVCRETYEIARDDGGPSDDDPIWDENPFDAVEAGSVVWDAVTVMRALPLMEGLPLEPVWLAMVGGGLDLEEAFALRPIDLRRVEVMGRVVTQASVHHATNDMERRKGTKTGRRRRIVTMMEPFGTRLWELSREVGERDQICRTTPSNQNRSWRSYFAKPLDPESDDPEERRRARHVKKGTLYKGRLRGFPYVALKNMRYTNASLMQEAGVLDSLNAAAHGHSQKVSYSNYQRADVASAAILTSEHVADEVRRAREDGGSPRFRIVV